MIATKRKRTELTLSEKYEIICAIDAGEKQNKVAQLFEVDRTTISKLMTKRLEVEAAFKGGDVRPTGKRQRKSSLPDLDEALLRWFKDTQSQMLTGIAGSELQKKASELSIQLGLGKTEITQSWINRWKQRHNIMSKPVCSGNGSIYMDAMNACNKASLLSPALSELAPLEDPWDDKTEVYKYNQAPISNDHKARRQQNKVINCGSDDLMSTILKKLVSIENRIAKVEDKCDMLLSKLKQLKDVSVRTDVAKL